MHKTTCCLQNYNQAQLQHDELLNRKKKEAHGDESNEETLHKLETLENRMQEQGESGEQSDEYQPGRGLYRNDIVEHNNYKEGGRNVPSRHMGNVAVTGDLGKENGRR